MARSRPYKKAARKRVRKSTARAMSVRGGFKLPPGYTLGDHARRLGRQALMMAKDEAINQAEKVIATQVVPKVQKYKKKAAGKINAMVDGAINRTVRANPYLQTESTKARFLGTNESSARRYITDFHYGKSMTRPVRNMAAQNGSIKEAILDTLYDAAYRPNTSVRNSLSLSTGFNQKLITAFNDMHITANDISALYRLNELNPVQKSTQRIYGLTKSLTEELRIMNVGRFFKAHVSIKMYKPSSNLRTVETTLQSSLPTQTEVTNSTPTDAIPLKYVFEGQTTNTVRTLAQVDPRISLTSSRNFNQRAEHVKTFTKSLAPGDVWDFKATHHCGAGIRLDTMAQIVSQSTNAIVSYLFVIEVKGSLCEGVSNIDPNESFVGTSPAFVQCEFKKSHDTIYSPAVNANQNWDTDPNEGGSISDFRFAIRSFIKEDQGDLNVKRINFSNSVIGPPGSSGELYIPVMAEATLQSAGEASNPN